MKIAALFLLILSVSVGFACRVKPVMTFEEIKHPAFTRRGVVEGGYEKTLDRVISEVRNELRDKYGAVDYEILFVDESGTWAGVEQFYAAQFTSGLGLERVAGIPGERATYHFGLWNRSTWFGLFGRSGAVAVAFVPDATPGSTPKQQFLVVFLPRIEN